MTDSDPPGPPAHYTRAKWEDAYNDKELKPKLCASSSISVSQISPETYLFRIESSNGTSEFEREMSTLPECISESGDPRLGTSDYAEYRFRHLYLHDVSTLSDSAQAADSGSGTDRAGTTLLDALESAQYYKCVVFDHCFFDAWSLPSLLVRDIVFEHCIFNISPSFSGRIQSSVSFDECILLKEFDAEDCYGLYYLGFSSSCLSGFRIDGLGLRELRISSCRDRTGPSKRDHATEQKGKVKRPNGTEEAFLRAVTERPFNSIRSSTISERLSIEDSSLSGFECTQSVIGSIHILGTRCERTLSLENNRVTGDVAITGTQKPEGRVDRAGTDGDGKNDENTARPDDICSCHMCDSIVNGDLTLGSVAIGYLSLSAGRFESISINSSRICELTMQDASIHGTCSIIGSEFPIFADMSRSSFDRDLELSSPRICGSAYGQLQITDARVAGAVSLVSAKCTSISADRIEANKIRMDGTSIDGSVMMEEALIAEALSMNGVSLSCLDLNQLKATDLLIDFDDECRVGMVLLRGTTIGNGFCVRNLHFVDPPSEPSSNSLRPGTWRCIDLSNSSLNGIASEISVEEADKDVRINLSGVDFKGRLIIEGLSFDRMVKREKEESDRFDLHIFQRRKSSEERIWSYAPKGWLRLRGCEKDAFPHLSNRDWTTLTKEWSTLEDAYRMQNDPRRRKDAHVWKCYCERRSLQDPESDEPADRFWTWSHRAGINGSYLVSCNGTSPWRVLFWILVCIGVFMLISWCAGYGPFDGAWFFLNMTEPRDPDDWLFSVLALIDGLFGITLTAEFVTVCNNRWRSSDKLPIGTSLISDIAAIKRTEAPG